MLIGGIPFLLTGQQPFVADAADFDGTNDYMLRGAGLTGAVDSKTGIFSAWVRLDGGDGASLTILRSTNAINAFLVLRRTDNFFAIGGDNAAGTEILLLKTSNAYTASSTWLHLLASWDLASAAGHLYINDASDISSPTLTNDTIDYTLANWGVGAVPGGTFLMNGCIAEMYFAPGQYLDFSVESNRRKFITAAGKPAYLGADGSIPTGTAPIMYHHLDNGEVVANFATNRGAGGNFAITGTLDAASTSPTD
ncbi:MAG: hypothetical protein B7Y56_02975 [Gallionellales bacterium 35-53-114]|jgi:hypothetical protein|nr:MAG: hypothetical protein B7Y56_02975 [Gallionellales bacterium 35-53-114]OYZ65070.1 MAG: hypothetical protein B7Y04_00135 [Gallionellales bacterium 24-53-125]OZB07979.1 MAG: hypothetical protein B7X61_10585 [Gallionellales bacterium 39-52-133]HQS59719.1 hypothetical protein [Gallionellaceae bacterium]HQS76473.1 hypothetical protein [Gallionellaceae bacterium]